MDARTKTITKRSNSKLETMEIGHWDQELQKEKPNLLEIPGMVVIE